MLEESLKQSSLYDVWSSDGKRVYNCSERPHSEAGRGMISVQTETEITAHTVVQSLLKGINAVKLVCSHENCDRSLKVKICIYNSHLHTPGQSLCEADNTCQEMQ